ncbi:MAG: hypothetical protein JNM22_02005 [Saprospiraceae bacterium]|nr:hypothetical protein [Saprospiraceae bacterium]
MKYRITINKNGNTASLVAAYDVDGLLQTVEFTTPGLNPAQILWMLSIVAPEEQNAGFAAKNFSFVKVEEIPMEVSFPVFWDTYGYKVGRLQAEQQWNKLTRADQARAIMQAPRYHQWRKQKSPPQEALHPERYLKNRRFDDEFKLN